ncbi:TonB-dependent siderophore receptor [Anabaena subtropica]|uniref:TonB-dependent siderophore receptor n=1 Tax=Anabaena subtropica FACHB-260 TaxID=2692884 RepID=A0ABR8CRF2_9NOST|nr:TonB-dependent siderophore receptor [Anabaena subtropica]MBD2345781.1 TonB-dependent siderophore receptor [Anabaena subtropica FACHB-260]
MKLDKFLQNLLLTSAVLFFIGTSARGEEVTKDAQGESFAQAGGTSTDEKVAVTDRKSLIGKSPDLAGRSRKTRLFRSQIANLLQIAKLYPVSKNISQLSEIERPATSAQVLVQSSTPSNSPNPEQTSGEQIVPITGVKANPTEKGVEVILETALGEQLQITNRSTGNNFIADIPGTQLRLSSGEAFTFRSENPIAEITEITVTNVDANTVRVTVVGEAALPIVELFDGDEGLIFSVASAATATQPPQEPSTPQTPPEESAAPQDEPIELVVTGEQDGYRVPDATTGTRTDTPLRDIPSSIQIVPRQVIEDRAVTNVAEALQNVSGTNSEVLFGTTAIPYLRGFDSAESFFRNGTSFGGNLGVTQFNFSTDNLERIEVLKGPASVLFGQGSPGGIINLVTKRPLSEPYYNLGFSAGSFSQIRPSFDFSGPLNPERSVLYRFIGSYDRARSFVDFANSERYFFTPSLEWNISQNTNLALDFEFIDSSQSIIWGIPPIGREIANVSRSRALVESGDFGDPFGKAETRRYNLGATFNHQFNQDWALRNTFVARWNQLRRAAIYADGGFDEATGDIERYRFTSDDSSSSYFNNLDVTGKFTTGSINHKLLIGFEFGDDITRRRLFLGDNDPSLTLNIFNPVYTTERFRYNSFPFNVSRNQSNRTYGFYLQDQIDFTDKFKLVLGGRYDIYQQEVENLIRSVTTESETSEFSPRVGLVYQPIQPVSLYASFVQGFEPNSATLADGSVPPPLRATQYEIGAKVDLGNLAATLAYFNITRTNIPTTDPNNPEFEILAGEVKSRGVELDVSGQILPGWNIIATYAYTDAFVSEDNNIPVGNRLQSTPRHSASLWSTYQIQRGNLQGVGFGLGFYYVGEREGDLDNSFILPSYLRTDASIFYRRDNFKAQLNFQNLFNIDYIQGTSGYREGGAFLGAPFSVVGSVSYSF